MHGIRSLYWAGAISPDISLSPSLLPPSGQLEHVAEERRQEPCSTEHPETPENQSSTESFDRVAHGGGGCLEIAKITRNETASRQSESSIPCSTQFWQYCMQFSTCQYDNAAYSCETDDLPYAADLYRSVRNTTVPTHTGSLNLVASLGFVSSHIDSSWARVASPSHITSNSRRACSIR